MALFTPAEISAQIAAYKAALLALATAQSYTMDIGGVRQIVTRAELPQIRATLEWLQQQSAAASGHSGPQSLIARPAR